MSSLNEYLIQKRERYLDRTEKALQSPSIVPLHAKVRAAGRSGVREIRIQDFQIISDSPEDFAGYNLGPSSPNLQLGVLGSCVTHIALIQAAVLQISLDKLEVEVTGELNPLAGKPGYEDVPHYPQNIRYTIQVVSNEPQERLQELLEAIERVCPIFNLLKHPQHIVGEIVRTEPA
jgi:uncharacterized OsmC-like protein